MNPLVTCIMPTRGRQSMAAKAVACFLAQTYEPKRLLVLEDADSISFPEPWLLPDSVKLITADKREDIATKRNVLCNYADSELICHWDSDDWSAPTRIEEQVRALQESGKAVTGYRQMYFYRPETNQAARYDGGTDYALGTSLMYRRDWWAAHPFKLPPATNRRIGHKPYGEDGIFVREAKAEGQIYSVSGLGMQVARAHLDNTSRKNLSSYKPAAVADLPAAFRELERIA